MTSLFKFVCHRLPKTPARSETYANSLFYIQLCTKTLQIVCTHKLTSQLIFLDDKKLNTTGQLALILLISLMLQNGDGDILGYRYVLLNDNF